MESVGRVPMEEPIVIGGRSHFATSTGRLIRVGPSAEVVGHEFVRCDFSQLDMSSGHYSHAKFIECTFDGADLTFATLDGTVFEHCSMKGLSAKHANLKLARFFKCNLEKATFNHASLMFTSFEGSSLGGTGFRRCHMYLTTYLEVNLSSCDFEEVTMIDGSFYHSLSDESIKLARSTMSNVYMFQCRMSFVGCDIEADNLVLSHCELGASICSNSVIHRSAFSYVIFDDSILFNIDVSESEFDHCSYYDAQIEDVRFDKSKYSNGFNSINPWVSDWSVVTSDHSGIATLDGESDQEDVQQ